MSAQLAMAFPAGSQPVDTSEDAADMHSPDWLDRWRRRVLAFVAARGELGATPDEAAAHFQMRHNTTSPRFTELLQIGYLARCDGKPGSPDRQRRPTRQGGTAFVHVITSAGRRALEQPTFPPPAA